MKNKKGINKDQTLLAAIVFAAITIAGSLVFLGLQIGSGNNNESLQEAIREGILSFVNEQSQANQVVTDVDYKKIAGPRSRDHIYGNPDAKISLIEYSDFLCPFCESFHTTAKTIVDNSNEQVNWIYRHFPLSGHEPVASYAALASECLNAQTNNDTFWQYSALLFLNRTQLDNELIVSLAGELGANTEKIQSCIDSEKYKDRVQDELQEGIDAGVSGTPGVIVYNSETKKAVRVSGAQPESLFDEVIKTTQSE